MRITVLTTLACLVLAAAPFISHAENTERTITLPNCLLSLDDEALVPAQEAGVLLKIPAKEGQQVAKGDLLAQIDDVLAQREYEVARYKLNVAEKQATDDIDVRYARAAYDVAEKKLIKYLEANRKTPGTVPETEVDVQKLERDKFRLSIEKAQKDLVIADLQRQVSEAEMKAAEAKVERRRIVAPLDAVVVELTHHEGEWVQPGDPVMRLVRVDRLRVEGFLNARDFRASEIKGRPVSVEVELARGQKEVFPGRIVYVKPLVEAGGEFLVRAEVENRRENGVWVLCPGLNAKMTIQLR